MIWKLQKPIFGLFSNRSFWDRVRISEYKYTKKNYASHEKYF